MAKKPLNERMRTGELYFVYTGIDFDNGVFRMLCYRGGAPRIYKKDRLDPRVGEIPISLNLKTAEQKLKRGVNGVLMPLSVLLEVFSTRVVSRWASSIDDDLGMRAYIKRWKKKARPSRLPA